MLLSGHELHSPISDENVDCIASQLKTVKITFQDGHQNYQLKMAVENHWTCPFWRKFYLESLGTSHNVALLFRNCISLLLFTIKKSYNQISRWPPKLSTQNGCQKLVNMPVLA